MKSRLYDPKDYEVISPWWEGHTGNIVPEAVLPKLGTVVEDDDGNPLAAAWLYMDNSIGVAWMSWLVSNPEIGPIKSVKAITLVLNSIEELCKEFNYGCLFTMTDRKGVGSFLGRNGFTANHSGMTQYFKKV